METRTPRNNGMKRTAQGLLVVTFLVLLSAYATRSLNAQEIMAPKLAINIPTLQLTNITISSNGSESGISGYLDIPWIAQYMRGVYSYAVSIAGILAGVMMIVGGFYYLTAGGDVNRVQKGKQRIADALIGLFLAFGAFVMLNTISPSLTSFEALRVKTVQRNLYNDQTFGGVPMRDAEHEPVTSSPSPPPGGAGSPPPSSGGAARPRTGTNVPAAACSRDFVRIRDIPGIVATSFDAPGHQIHRELSANLVALSQAIAEMHEVINIGGTTRTQDAQFRRHVQIKSACGDGSIGVPAPSNRCAATGHAAGRAIDMNIGGRHLCTRGGVNIPQLMNRLGWTRLCIERWHYEVSSDHPRGLQASPRSGAGIQCFGGGNDDLNSLAAADRGC